jgi:hypothetical protein
LAGLFGYGNTNATTQADLYQIPSTVVNTSQDPSANSLAKINADARGAVNQADQYIAANQSTRTNQLAAAHDQSIETNARTQAQIDVQPQVSEPAYLKHAFNTGAAYMIVNACYDAHGLNPKLQQDIVHLA